MLRAALQVAAFAKKKPLAAAGGALIVCMLIVALLAPVIAPHGPKEIIGDKYLEPRFSVAWNNWGTDHLGRDVFSRIVWGARLSLFVGFAATFLGTSLGMVWGVSQGYWGGKWFDTLSQRILEAMLSIPGLILALTFIAVLGPSVTNVVLAIAIGFIPSKARIARAVTLSLRENAYVDAARATGASDLRIIFVHIMPNIASLYIIYMTLHLGSAIITEASLSFLGVGVPPDEPSWGGMITRGVRQVLLGGIPWLAIFPGACIGAAVYGFNLLGDGLRDAPDPRLRGSQGARN